MTKSTADLERVFTSRPINATAARVVSKGTHWNPVSYRNEREWSTPPSMKQITASMRIDPNFTNLTGTPLGNLVCVGISSEPESKAKGGSKWVMRCTCGNYVIRSTRSIKKQGDPDDCCPTCQALRAIRYHQSPAAQQKRRVLELESKHG